MAKFFGKIGYGESVQVKPGVWQDKITERSYYGDVTRMMKQYVSTDKVIPDLRTNNQIRFLADAFALENFTAIKYVEWMGARWSVSNVEVARPRLVLDLGGVYNGPTATP